MNADAPDPRIPEKRRLRPWRLTVLTCVLLVIAINPLLCYHGIYAVQGWYQSIAFGNWWIVSPLEGIESILTGKELYLPALVGMLAPLVTAFLLGRVFCSWLCPITLLLEIGDWLRGKVGHLGDSPGSNRRRLPRALLWLTLVGELLLSMVLGAPVFVFLSPPGLVGREIMMLVFFGILAIEGLLLVAIFALEAYGRRAFCGNLCPLGALLALVGIRRRLKVRLDADACTACGHCVKTCPMGLNPDKGEAASAYCWNCGDCLDHCPARALNFRWQ